MGRGYASEPVQFNCIAKRFEKGKGEIGNLSFLVAGIALDSAALYR